MQMLSRRFATMDPLDTNPQKAALQSMVSKEGEEDEGSSSVLFVFTCSLLFQLSVFSFVLLLFLS
jgi:hypothetical protein